MSLDDELIIICACHSFEHQAIFWDGEEWGMHIYFHLNTHKGFWGRLWHGLQYAFGYKSRYGCWDEFILNDEDKDKLIAYLTKHNSPKG
jgi:hypothetical protein